jgi:hypothetical protein
MRTIPEGAIEIIPGRIYTLRMPASEVMIHMGRHGTLQTLTVERHNPKYAVSRYTPFQVLFLNPQEKGEKFWPSGCSLSECGIYQIYGDTPEEDLLYAYPPDVTETPEQVQKQTAEAQRALAEVLDKAGAVKVERLI